MHQGKTAQPVFTGDPNKIGKTAGGIFLAIAVITVLVVLASLAKGAAGNATKEITSLFSGNKTGLVALDDVMCAETAEGAILNPDNPGHFAIRDGCWTGSIGAVSGYFGNIVAPENKGYYLKDARGRLYNVGPGKTAQGFIWPIRLRSMAEGEYPVTITLEPLSLWQRRGM